MDWIYYLILLAVMVGGLFLNLLTLPGIWIMVLAAGGYVYITHLSYAGYGLLIAMVVLALLAELAEFLMSGSGAKQAGGTMWGFFGAIIGSILGGIFLTFIPIPIVSTVFGVCLGAALGAFLAELIAVPDYKRSFRIGVGAFKGRFKAIIVKLAFGAVVFVLAAFMTLPLGGRRIVPAASSPTTLPTTAPTTLPVIET